MNFSSKKLTINAVTAVIQVVVTALLYFFLYKYLVVNLGIEQLGIWSLILSFSSIANLANLGLTSGLVKFVAEYLASDDKSKLGKLIFTSLVSMSLLFSLISLIIYSFSDFFLVYIMDEKFVATALEILPYSLLSLCINAVGGIFTSVLEGYQKNYIRNFLYIISGFIMIGTTFILTPQYRLKGVAISQLLQSFFIFISSLFFVLKCSSENSISKWRWSTTSFKELFNYGYKFQVVSICQLLYEPATKLLISKFGGLAILGNYEMANKAVSQFRALLTSANQVVIPIVAEKSKVEDIGFLRNFYIKMNKILLILNLPLSTALLISVPLISLLWLGFLDQDFIFAMIVLVIMTFINVMCGPAYFSALGEGRLNILVVVHSAMAVINILLGMILGKFFGGYGVIISWGIALIMGSVALIINYNRKVKITIEDIFGRQELKFFIISLIIISLNFLIYYFFKIRNIYQMIGLVVTTMGLFLPFLLKSEIVIHIKSLLITKKSKDA
ncbi:lipopolysaccharide biosynthesis protein [Chryseobacterium binzhouense]|uniref:lipopolysaccharide biosynthesis protein n=1 Tax=Chryseobacterium binzhouense TaxID=2593646 RepID=UPI00289F6665|nr:oligosaccharide flippase family protein [Chryseobacterium binzhouense]